MTTRRTLAAIGIAGALAATTALTPVLAAEAQQAKPAAAQQAGTSAPQKPQQNAKADTGKAMPQQSASAQKNGDMNKGQTQQSASAQQPMQDQDKALLRISGEVVAALQNVRAARVAIFNGDTDNAKKLMASITKDFDAAKSSASDITITPQKSDAAKDRYVPFDVSMALAEGFTPTQDKAEPLKQAHEQMTNGDQKQAAEVLRLADIDVVVSAALLPIDGTTQNAADASKLMDQGKYYEANLALKKIEDSILVDTYDLTGVPTQGHTG